MSPESVASWLAAGDGVRAVFLSLVRDGVPPDAAATAVCVAAGSRREDAVERLGQFAGLWEELRPGEEADGIDLLIAQGCFEPDADLDDRRREARDHLRAALSSVTGIPSGAAASLSNRLRTGRLVDAHLQLERLGGRRWPDNARFWAALRRAGELLGPGADPGRPQSPEAPQK
ncbi:hypothetical protein Asp14428_21160 [Actinoplanes sp. NBRC 14428]|nr:hypothetical protein Asp14428_21160 [Actinoplanes sp. NBRC 14428]